MLIHIKNASPVRVSTPRAWLTLKPVGLGYPIHFFRRANNCAFKNYFEVVFFYVESRKHFEGAIVKFGATYSSSSFPPISVPLGWLESLYCYFKSENHIFKNASEEYTMTIHWQKTTTGCKKGKMYLIFNFS